MTDFKPIIIRNLALFPGIVESPEVIANIDSLLQRVEQAGHHKLIGNFCSQNNSERARDLLLELWVCDLLSRDSRVERLQYEPEEETNPPDFRFKIDDCTFDIQVKRMHNVKNEIIRQRFQREIEHRLSRIPRPWFINYSVSEKLQPKHINAFFEYLGKNIDKKKLARSKVKGLMGEHYHWKQDGELLVSYAFTQNNSGELGIQLGICHSPYGVIDLEAIRKSVKKRLRQSQDTLKYAVSATQSNIVLVEAVGDVWLHEDTMGTSLWGDRQVNLLKFKDGSRKTILRHSRNGLFRGRQFDRICGVILVGWKAHPIDRVFNGTYFAHPMHLHHVEKHPKPFDDMQFCIPAEWRSVGVDEGAAR